MADYRNILRHTGRGFTQSFSFITSSICKTKWSFYSSCHRGADDEVFNAESHCFLLVSTEDAAEKELRGENADYKDSGEFVFHFSFPHKHPASRETFPH